jgi:poly-gamma-glutamate capsule biosynthesis protein CapA/YwtB (metallophosphatase superfamily)
LEGASLQQPEFQSRGYNIPIHTRFIRLSAVTLFWLVPLVLAAGETPQSGADSVSHDRVVLRFAGDLLLGGHYADDVGDSVSRAFEEFDALKTADIAMVNLENPITTRGVKVTKKYNFRMNPRFVRAITDGGITIVSIANNHIYDYGKEGLFDTISYLDSAGIRHVGAGRTRRKAHQPVVMNIRGKRVAFLAYYGGPESPAAGLHSPGVARRSIFEVAADIAGVRDSTDYIVVSLHWGTEKADHPDQGQIAFAHAVINAGADAVIGHHPHVIQGIERYRHGVIAYSLGNFIFGGNSLDSYDTGIFEISLDHDEPQFAFLPVRVHAWRASLLSGEDSASVMDRVRRLSRIFPRTIFTK